MTQDFYTLLECPLSGSPLKLEKGKLTGVAGTPSYPFIGGLPWLYRYPDTVRLQWQAKANNYLAHWKKRENNLIRELQASDRPLAETQLRLENMRDACRHNHQAFNSLLKPLLGSDSAKSFLHFAGHDRIPTHQDLIAYQNLLMRDWAWNNDEISSALEAVAPHWPSDPAPKGVLVLGAGACRLPYELHRKFSPEMTIAVDINPLLFWSAQSILNGNTLSIYEFPLNPIDSSQYAVLNHCRNQGVKPQGFHLLFADALNLPLKASSVDLVLTPWLIDILPAGVERLAQGINFVLKEGGHWLNFGPLGFEHSLQSLCYSREEMVKIIGAQCGFSTLKQEVKTVPYLQSPNGGHGRLEKVFCFSAQKVRGLPRPEPFELLPQWLLDFNQAIPLNPEIAELTLTSQLHGEILGLVSGHNSFHQIASTMVTRYKLAPAQAEESLFSLLSRIHEVSLRRK